MPFNKYTVYWVFFFSFINFGVIAFKWQLICHDWTNLKFWPIGLLFYRNALKQGETRTSHGPIPHPLRGYITVYCLTIIGCNFVFNDLLHQTLISNNGPWFTFPCTFDDIMMMSSGFRGNPIFLIIPCFWKKWNHLSNSNFASSISRIISKILRYL